MLEVSAEKPGNITPSHDFHDTTYEDMLRSAIAVGPELARAGERGVGDTVLAVVQASRRAAQANTNLGIALLLAPLARAALAGGPLRERLGGDAGCARRGRRARRVRGDPPAPAPAACDERVEHDVRSEPTVGLREAMASAAARDSIAAEYVSDFALTFETGVPALVAALGDGLAEREAIVELHLRLLDGRAGHADRAQARRRGGGAGVGGRTRRAARRRRAHRGRAAGAAELRRIAARAGQRAEPRDHRRPGDRDPVRRAARGYALTPSHRASHFS